MSLLTVSKLTKHFGGLTAVNNVSLSIEEGEIVGLIGPNGAGKTTIFNLVSGFIVPSSGDVTFNGKSLNGLTRTFPVVPPFTPMVRRILWVLGVSAVIVAALTLFFRFTTVGRAMRACADDRTAARLCGVNDRGMVTLSFMLSAGIGALAGCVISPVTQTQYDMGAPLAIKGFTVAILGGLGNSMAAVAAGLFLGLLESFTVSQLASAYKEVVAIVVLLLILVFRPSGLFARRETSRGHQVLHLVDDLPIDPGRE